MNHSTDYFVFVDESGSTILADQAGGLRYYVAVAVIVAGSDVESLNSMVEDISIKFNGGKPLKSSKIARDVSRRMKLLRGLRQVSFKYTAIAIDKNKIDTESGLRYRQSFYKYLNRLLYQDVSSSLLGSIHCIVDAHGSEEYQKSAFEYFRKNCDLFNQLEIEKVDDDTSRLVQLADIISGSLRIWLSEGINAGDPYREMRQILQSKEISLRCWPVLYSCPETIQMDEGCGELDAKVGRVMVSKACELISKFEGSSDDDDLRKAIVLRTLIEARISNEDVFCDKLIEIVNRILEKKVGRKSFLSNVIGGIRKEGVIIAGTHRGYRLATTMADVKEYLRQDKTVILPMLTKLICARKLLLASSDVDILDGTENGELRECAMAFSDAQISAEFLNQEIDDEGVLPED